MSCVCLHVCRLASLDICVCKYSTRFFGAVMIFSVAGTCTCQNGIASTGPDCPVDGAAHCMACHIGWTLSHDSTKCNGILCVTLHVSGRTKRIYISEHILLLQRIRAHARTVSRQSVLVVLYLAPRGVWDV